MNDYRSNNQRSTRSEAPFIEAREIYKSLLSSNDDSSPIEVVRDFSLQVSEGELVTFFGPNGSGKTTILNILAGLLQADSGSVEHNSARDLPLSVGYVFQNYADTLFPWRSVRDNIAFPLELRRLAPVEIARRVEERLEQFHLSEHGSKYIYELSGGLKQLVAIARATAYEPQLLLLDEPFSALDYSLSRTLWLRFREFWTSQRVTTVFVSHNIDEAVFLGDRVYVLSARPAHVVTVIPVTLGRDRPLSLLSSTDFFAIRKQVLEAFEDGRQQQ